MSDLYTPDEYDIADAQDFRDSFTDDYDRLLSGIKDGLIDSVICEKVGKAVNIPDDYDAGYRIGSLIFEIYKHVQPLPQADNQEG